MNFNDRLQVLSSNSLGSNTIDDASPAQSMNDYGIVPENDQTLSPESTYQETAVGNTDSVPASLKRECPTDTTEVSDKQKRRDRNDTKSNSSNDDRDEKSPIEIIDRKTAFFPDRCANLPRLWYLYKIDIAGEGGLGFIVPCELSDLSEFNLYRNDEALQVQLSFLELIDYGKWGSQLECFCQYLFEEVFDDMHTGSNSILKFDLKHSTFQLLPCLLKESGELDYELDYERMALICDRKQKSKEKLFEINDREVYVRSDLPGKHFFTSASGTQKDSSKVTVTCIAKPSIDYLKNTSSSANKKQKTSPSRSDNCSIEKLRYAPLNRADLELIYKLPSVLSRIPQLYHMEKLEQLLADDNHLNPVQVVDAHRMPVVTFNDYLLELLSSDPSAALPLVPLNYSLLSTHSSRLQWPPDLIFQSISGKSAAENTNMESLETLGDSFLRLAVSLSFYHRYPFDDIGKLTKKRANEVSNDNLYRLAIEKKLQHYLNARKIIFCGEGSNWIPPGYTVDEENSDRYLKQKVKKEALADMIEALIAAVLVYAGYSAAIKFMNWLGLDVIPSNEHGMIQLPTVLRNNDSNHMNEIRNAINEDYQKRSFAEIENKINYVFNDKGYLMAAFTHPSCSKNVNTINYKRLKYVGNALLEFLITRYILITSESITPGHISDVRQHLLTKDGKANITLVNNLHVKMMCASQKSTDSKPGNITDNNSAAAVLEALIGAVFFDSNYSLEVVWDVIHRLVEKHIDLKSSIEKPILNIVRSIREKGGIITDTSPDGNGNFVCQVKLSDGTQVEGLGKTSWAIPKLMKSTSIDLTATSSTSPPGE